MPTLQSTKEFEEYRQKLSIEGQKIPLISISAGTCSLARGAREVIESFREEIQKHQDRISLKITGCHGYCEAEPNIIIFPEEIFYQHVKPNDATRIIEATLTGQVVDDLVCQERGQKFPHLSDIPFYKNQMRVLLGGNPWIDPTDIDDYILFGGYQALIKTLNMRPEEVIEEITHSGLRGRGGAGFPTGKKWEIARQQKNDIKYIICNADEGDPGAYMDRSLLEGNPHSVLEGMLAGAYAIGATEGWIYVRDEYPLAVTHVTKALEQAYELGLLGQNILQSAWSFDIHVIRGAGSFVCGEETALMHSIENKRGVPRQRPPFPAKQGLWGKPTNINNVETWANVPHIINKGADWFSGIGTDTSKGTKIFSLVGKVKNTGLIEVPMGISLKEIVYAIGGGSPSEKSIKAIQTGGPSGGCIPAELFDLAVDYESLQEVGSIMGSGGMIVMDEDTCMVDIARYYTNFLQTESCGKCAPCREGTKQMFHILTDITQGNLNGDSLELLQELGDTIRSTALCALGQTAPNPVLSTIKYFEDEYKAHIHLKECPAGVCKALITYVINAEDCNGCGLCAKNCPQDAIQGEKKEPHRIIQERCIKCGICLEVCTFNAISKQTKDDG